MSRYGAHNHYRTEADAARRLIWFLLLLLGVALMVGLYYVKTRAQSARHAADALAFQIRHEQAAISVLRAEIAHLESPERIQALAEDELGLVPISPERMIAIDDIAATFPLREVVPQSDAINTDTGTTP